MHLVATRAMNQLASHGCKIRMHRMGSRAAGWGARRRAPSPRRRHHAADHTHAAGGADAGELGQAAYRLFKRAVGGRCAFRGMLCTGQHLQQAGRRHHARCAWRQSGLAGAAAAALPQALPLPPPFARHRLPLRITQDSLPVHLLGPKRPAWQACLNTRPGNLLDGGRLFCRVSCA